MRLIRRQTDKQTKRKHQWLLPKCKLYCKKPKVIEIFGILSSLIADIEILDLKHMKKKNIHKIVGGVLRNNENKKK